MHKMKMLLAMYEAIETNSYFIVAIKHKELKEAELILNPSGNLVSKMKYYSDAYTENLELKLNSDIKIVAYAVGKDKMEAINNITHKLQGDIC